MREVVRYRIEQHADIDETALGAAVHDKRPTVGLGVVKTTVRPASLTADDQRAAIAGADAV